MNESIESAKYRKMTETPVEKLVTVLAVPTIISMLVTAFYNMADTFFIGKITENGTAATGAAGVVFSYMALIQAIAFFFGHGSGNFISRELGAKRRNTAEKMAATGFFAAFISGCVIMILGLIFSEPILTLLGATDTILPEAKKYFFYILLSTPFMISCFVLNNHMRFQGNAKRAMYGIASGAVLNVVLDPIFIFTFKMGVSGASLATAISQFISFCILFKLSKKDSGLVIKLKNFKPELYEFSEIAAGGLPSLCRQGLAAVTFMFLNRAAGTYGDSAIAAFSVVSRISNIANSALIGFGQGFQPVCGFNYGAKKYNRVRRAYVFCIIASTVFMTCLGSLLFVFSSQAVAFFRGEDPVLLDIASKTLKYQALCFPLLGVIIITNMFLQNIRKPFKASVLAMSRQGIAFLPVLFVLSSLIGLLGIELSQSAADIISFLIALPLSASEMKLLKAEACD